MRMQLQLATSRGMDAVSIDNYQSKLSYDNFVDAINEENASAASALLYNIVGQGQAFNNLRKHFDEIVKKFKLK